MSNGTTTTFVKAVENGNPYVKIPHIFVPHQGTFFPTREIAIEQGTTPNGVGLWEKTFEHNGKTYFKAGNTNCWD